MASASDPTTQRDAIVARLKRVEGQLRGIERMIEARATCEQVAQQLSAARHALDRAFFGMIACSMTQELDQPGASVDDARESVAHVSHILAKYG